MQNILTLPTFQDIILPFVLIFVLFFAILQKSQLFGEKKNQIDAILAFVVAGVLISFGNAVGIITKLTVFMAVAVFILFVFMLIYTFAFANKTGDPLSSGIKTAIGAIAAIAVVIAVLFITGYWDKVYSLFTTSDMGMNIIFLVLIVGAIVAVLKGGSSGGSKE